MPRLRRSRRAAAALEFALVAPVFLVLLFDVLGVGVVGFYQLTLDDAVRDAARTMQINSASASAAGLVAAVCAEFGALDPACATRLTYNVQAASQGAGFGGLTPATLSAAGALSDGFFAAGQGYGATTDLLVQVAYPMPFTLPFVGSLVTLTGTSSIMATAAVRAEPHQ